MGKRGKCSTGAYDRLCSAVFPESRVPCGQSQLGWDGDDHAVLRVLDQLHGGWDRATSA